MIIFDRKLYKQYREKYKNKFAESDFLYNEVSDNIVSRLYDTSRKFQNVLDISAKSGYLASELIGKNGISSVIKGDVIQTEIVDLVFDPEAIPFAGNSFDLIVSALDLQLVNDVPGSLIQIRDSLKKNGMFIGVIFGPSSLRELKQVLFQTEMELNIPISPHIIPFIDIKDLGSLAQRAGFEVQIVDSYTITVYYKDIFKLMQDLRYNSFGNILVSRSKKFLGKDFFLKAEENYKNLFSNEEGELIASFEFLTLTAIA